ncbi:ATP-binding protein [Streptomyces sp. NPDC058108]|uniref:ATP-binding protein n=1 Tax=Streptomyces sp. NPDC058108 TaxID=3346344 RepID=UPI0036E140EC
MLGRQQIAGIPTAINELFKNSYDAYATTVVVDWLRDRDFLVVRDDGIGMSHQDFLDRWLTIGTDSKTAGGRLRTLPIPPNMRRRPVMGEKGIGRLAIAALGAQTLVLSRRRDDDAGIRGESLVVAALIPWKLFEVPGIRLDEIDIPVVQLPPEEALSNETNRRLVKSLLGTLRRLRALTDHESLDLIEKDLLKFQSFDLESLKRLRGPNIVGPEAHGTFFIVSPTDESLPMEVDGDRARNYKDRASQLVKLLTGFSDTMSKGRRDPEMRTSFIVRRDSGEAIDLIDGDEFFTDRDFEKTDHEFVGEFDEYGTFRGSVSIYQQAPESHIVTWPAGGGAPTQCGPFKIRFGYVHAELRRSSLSPEVHAEINGKLDQVAGLYVYRDGVRILPYGSSDIDYLGIEERRSRNAGYYFFSYRRMFGAIEVSSSSNSKLQEKAGREGFRENIAYRQFQAILINFITQLAADFFRSSSDRGREFLAMRDELARTERVRRRRDKVAGSERDIFRQRLQAILGKFAQNEPQARVLEVVESVERRLSVISHDGPSALDEALEIEKSAEGELRNISARYSTERPRGIGLDRETGRDWSAYEREHEILESRHLVPAATAIHEKVASLTSSAVSLNVLNRRIREETEEELKGNLAAWIQEAQEIELRADGIASQVLEKVRAAVGAASRRVNDLAREVGNNADLLDQEELFELRQRALEELNDELTQQQQSLAPVRAYLNGFESTLGGNDWSEEMEAVEEEVLALRNQVDTDLELTQLGRAIELINHEFASSIKAVRRNLRALRPWGNRNPQLGAIERELAAAFEHLDNYLALFTPLQRRLYRKPTRITGAQIQQFVTDLFGERLRRHEVELVATEAFLRFTFVGYPSTFYPVFVNLVDNAIFWLSDRPLPRTIQLDETNGRLRVSDNGPGILPRDREAVFEHGFSRKPGGRGLGLKISRDVLRRSGWSLDVDPEGGLIWPHDVPRHVQVNDAGRGASFSIIPPADEELN